MDRRVTVFIDRSQRWPAELAALRAILLGTDLDEAFKWRQPVYTFEGANVAILWAFNESCGLGFFRGALMKDPEGLLVAPGANSRAARKIPFTSVGEIEAGADMIRAYVSEAIAIQKAGLTVDMPKDDLEPPAELTDALDADPELRWAWEALTPGRRRGYILHVGEAKKTGTRKNRIEKHAPRILKGLGLHDR